MLLEWGGDVGYTFTDTDTGVVIPNSGVSTAQKSYTTIGIKHAKVHAYKINDPSIFDEKPCDPITVVDALPTATPKPTVPPTATPVSTIIPTTTSSPGSPTSTVVPSATTSPGSPSTPGTFVGICGIGESNLSNFVSKLFGCGVSLVGGVSLLFIIYGGFLMLSSTGDPNKIRIGREYITYAIIGLLLAVFAFVILQVIGKDILELPGFGS